ncbi:MAG TPA: 4-hydroxy-3-methylbut-2-enyl diphosphate reductase, partial [Blastocatellia bacterium]|nr:4-hydroxy-3-methylbut-2-enyl diphosphate reductase [Blastocatellia bacterium]
CIVSCSLIRHKRIGETRETFTDNWLPEGDVRIGMTAGASTPDRLVGEVIDRLVNCCAGL